MPENDAPRSTRPPPRERPKGPYYKASMVLAVVFLGLALSLPLWLDRVRQPVDTSVLQRDLQSVPAAAPIHATTPGAAVAASARVPANAPETTNTSCRAYVYERCNALRVSASECLPIALDATRVPLESGLTACREAVGERLKAAAGTHPDEEAGAAAGAETVAGEAGATPGAPAGAGTAAPAKDKAGAPGETPAKPAEVPGASRLPPAQQAEKLAKVLQVLEELQRGSNNYATLPAAQQARMAEIRALVEEVGSDDAKRMYNQLRDRYVAPPPPTPGAPVGESPRMEAGGAGTMAAPSTPEMDRVRGMVNDARKQAGMAPLPAPSADDALRSRSPDEAAAPAAIEQRP